MEEHRFVDRELETASPEEIRARQTQQLRELLTEVAATNDFYRDHWRKAGVDVTAIDSLEEFAARVPTVGKADFLADQEADPPFGRRHAYARSQGVPVYVSTTSGTSGQGQEVHLQTQREWEAMGRVYHYLYRWAGLEVGDGLALALPMTMLGGGRLEYHGALSYGLSVYPVGNYEAGRKIDTIRRFGPAGVIGITAYLGRLANELGDERAPSVRAVLTGGEGAGIEWLRRLEREWDAKVYDRYGSSQAGNDHMFSCERGIGTVESPGTLHNIDPHVLTEVIDPATGAQVAPGETGELVVTVLYRRDAPIIRCRMGDRGVYVPAGSCPCGRPFSGVEVASIGRVDDMRKIKGVNVWPQAVDDAIFEHAEVAEYQVVLASDRGGSDVATLKVMPGAEPGPDAEALQGRIARAVKERIGISFEVELAAPASLEGSDWKARRWIDRREHITRAEGAVDSTEKE